LTIAIYPGSFDPITNGHIDIASRAAKLFDKVIIGIFATPDKKKLTFTVDERVDLAERAVAHMPNVTVKAYDCLTTKFAKEVNATVMVRGLRIRDDFEREFDFAIMNKRLHPGLELVCLMASHDYQFLSSSLIKEVAGLGGDIYHLVPDYVVDALQKKGLNAKK
jgi:pantetheine-phosphate adenylyltransferase